MQLCNHPFSFTKVYAQNAPSKLPFREFAWGLTVRASHSVRFGLRVSTDPAAEKCIEYIAITLA